MRKGQPVWWRPKNVLPPWYERFPKKQDLAVTIVRINNKEKTALVEYLNIRREPVRFVVSLDELRPRMLK